MQSGILLLVLAGVCWVLIGVAISHAALKRENLKRIQADSAILCAIPAVVLIGFGKGGTFPAWWIVLLLFLAGTTNYFTFLLMNRAMRYGPHGLVWSIIQSALVWPFLFGVICFGAVCSWLHVVGFLLILCGILAAGKAKNGTAENNNCPLSGKHWLRIALGAFVPAGLTQCINNFPSYLGNADTTPYVRGLLILLGTILGFTISVCFDRRAAAGKVCWKSVLLLTGANIASCYFFFYRGLDLAAEAGAGAIGYPVTLGSCIAGFALYSVFILRERITIASASSFLLCLSGMIAMSIQ
ncbi:DMT family transporter [uncultured Victivallis sp.]|uniref:DMT family transporter n=1 Tax=uncultured Victivallis sp. TaxID=354118 RepID=UPI0025F4E039|nr:DMT family transporter [uncultured Victivallis sp.]